MTRINVVPVEELTDNFIMAEYFELPRMWRLIQKAIASDDRDLPPKYILGKGHLRFFYDKITYLDLRHSNLWQEGMRRGLTLQKDPGITVYFQDVINMYETARLLYSDANFWLKNYIPTDEALQLNRDRLQVRRRYEGGSYPAK